MRAADYSERMTKPATRSIEILKPGSFTDVNGVRVTFTPRDIEELVATYDAACDPAPAVIGHPKTDDPAYAWTESLSLQNGRVVAQIGQIDPGFENMVSAGRYKRISPSIYPRSHPANPAPGKYYLKHIGFLGAAPPAIKGLAPVAFSEDVNADCITIEINLSEQKSGVQKEKIMSKKEDQPFDLAEAQKALADREAAVAERERELAGREASIEQAGRDAASVAAISFAESLVEKMVLPPAHKDRAAYLLATLAAQGEEILSFGEGDNAERPIDALKALLNAAQPALSFGELAKPEDKAAALSFASPDGHAVDTAALEIHNRAVRLQQEDKNLSYLDAVRRASAAAA